MTKFKENAVEHAIYQLLGMGSGILMFVSVMTLLYTGLLVIGIAVAESNENLGAAVGTALGTFIIAVLEMAISDRLKKIQHNMVEQSDNTAL